MFALTQSKEEHCLGCSRPWICFVERLCVSLDVGQQMGRSHVIAEMVVAVQKGRRCAGMHRKL